MLKFCAEVAEEDGLCEETTTSVLTVEVEPNVSLVMYGDLVGVVKYPVLPLL